MPGSPLFGFSGKTRPNNHPRVFLDTPVWLLEGKINGLNSIKILKLSFFLGI